MKFFIYISFILLLSSCFNSRLTIKKIKKIEVYKLPYELDVRVALNTVEKFDDLKDMIDTNIFEVNNFKILLGSKLKKNSLDSRTKVILTKKNGDKITLLINETGKIIFNGKIYEGSLAQLLFLRQDKIK